MELHRYSELIEAVEEAILSSGHTSLLMSSEDSQPFQLALAGPGMEVTTLWAYLRTLNAAARSNPDEYRIQLKGADLPLAMNPAGPTVLLGYHALTNLFVGFDPLTVSSGAK